MKKYHKLTENAVKPAGFWGKLMIRSMNKGHHALTDWALEHVSVQNGFRVLDVGCGGGKTVGKLCSMVGSGKVYGVDYSELCVKKSEKLLFCVLYICGFYFILNRLQTRALSFLNNVFGNVNFGISDGL